MKGSIYLIVFAILFAGVFYCGFLNRARGGMQFAWPKFLAGKKVLPKFISEVSMGLPAALSIWLVSQSWILAALTFGLLYLGNLLGFQGDGLGCWFPWDNDTSSECNHWEDRVTAKIVGYKYVTGTDLNLALKYKLVAMCIRFGVYFAPYFMCFAAITYLYDKTLWPLIGIPFMFFVGFLYKIGFNYADKSGHSELRINYSEWLTGFWKAAIDLGIFCILFL